MSGLAQARVSFGDDPLPGFTPTDPRQAGVEPDEEAIEERERAVLVLGTAHVVPLEAAIQHHTAAFEPNAVALELDPDRLRGLLADPDEREKPGWGYGLVAKFQEKVASDLGGEVGEEMLAAREAGMRLGVPVALVDRPVQETLDRLLDEMGWFERFKVLGSVLASFIPGKNFEDELQRALEGDPDLVEEVAERFPAVKKVLIDERDVYMAERVRRLTRDYPRVVLVAGDAHVPGLLEELAPHVDEVSSVRVGELREFDPADLEDDEEDDAAVDGAPPTPGIGEGEAPGEGSSEDAADGDGAFGEPAAGAEVPDDGDDGDDEDEAGAGGVDEDGSRA